MRRNALLPWVVGATGIWLSSAAVDALAQSTRPYQMSIVGTTEGSTTVDIPIFHYQHTQPAGRSIVWWDPADEELDDVTIDWTRIVAVYVDEPYNAELPQGNPSCSSLAFEAKRRKLQRMATAARTKAPSARFWINFRAADIFRISSGCPLNGAYIDVISMDYYGIDFHPPGDNGSPYALYQWLYANRATPYQQLALIPGTFTGGGANQTGTEGAARLSGYFDYAYSMNQQCDLPLGPMGRTGIYDGCPVWMVAGWFGGTEPHRDSANGPWHYPIDHANAIQVRNAWQSAFAVRRVDPARVSQALKAAPLLFND
jgi:hypothetical protein